MGDASNAEETNTTNPFEIGNVEDDDNGVEEGLENNGHSLPSPEEIKTTPTTSAGECWYTIVFFVMLALMTSAVVGLSVGLTADNRQDGGKSNNTFTPQQGDNTRIEEINAKRAEEFKKYFIENQVNTGNEFEDDRSAQSKAITYLAAVDKKRYDVPKGGISTAEGYELLTRYVMAIIYYDMNGQSWNFEMLFLSDHDTCEWFELFQGSLGQVGVLCNENTRQIVGLSFINNKLKGNIPKELGHLTTITYLESIGNEIMGSIPDELQQMSNLRTLVLSRGLMTGPIPDWLGTFTNLEFLYLSNNDFIGSIPTTFKNLKNLAVLGLDDNSLRGSIDAVWDMPKLEYLYLEDNQFTGGIPSTIMTTSPLLIELDASTNNLGGEIPSSIFRLTNLQIIDLHGNSFAGGIPSDISFDNQRLEFLALHENALTSSIPPAIGKLKNLRHLDLTGNSLSGNFPTELSQLDNLRYLFLSNNPFTPGTIPAYMYDYPVLEELSLRGTKRTGKISELVGTMDKLILLDLGDNQLTGPIPEDLGSLTKLQFLLLHRNELDGSVPATMSAMTSLRVFMLNRNEITGSLNDVCNVKPTMAIADCAEVNCTCCTTCCSDDTTCEDSDLVGNINPTYELRYKRQFFDFSSSEGTMNVGDDDVLANMDSP